MVNIGVQRFYYQFESDLKKEKLKIGILFLLFLFQVITSIITTFYMDELLQMFGIEFLNPIEPSGEVAFLDFLNDQILFGLLIMTLGTMNIFSSDISDGSIEFYLSRPISRTNYTISKSLSRIISLITPLLLASICGWVYLGLTFEWMSLTKLLVALIPLILLFIYFITITGMLSARYTSTTAGMGSLAIIIVQLTISAFKPLELLSPFTLSSIWSTILMGDKLVFTGDNLLYIGGLLFWVIIPLIIAIHIMRTRDF